MPEHPNSETACACGCGEPPGPGSRYAGSDERERMRHRARLQYLRRRDRHPGTEPPTDGPREEDLLGRLGLADAPLTAVAERLAVLAGDIGGLAATVARRADDLDEDAVTRRISAAVTDAVTRAETAEDHARQLRASLRDRDQELYQARRDRDQADADAALVAENATVADTRTRDALHRAELAEHATADAHTAAEQAREELARTRADAEARITQLDRDHAHALAAVRAEHANQLAGIHKDYATLLADTRADHATQLAQQREHTTESLTTARDRALRAEAHADALTRERAALLHERDTLTAEIHRLRDQIATVTGAPAGPADPSSGEDGRPTSST